MWDGEAWHMWCEMFLTEAAISTEAGYVRFSPIEYPYNCPPSVDEILRYAPVLKQQLTLKLAGRQADASREVTECSQGIRALVTL